MLKFLILLPESYSKIDFRELGCRIEAGWDCFRTDFSYGFGIICFDLSGSDTRDL
jgi:hypothetical protein